MTTGTVVATALVLAVFAAVLVILAKLLHLFRVKVLDRVAPGVVSNKPVAKTQLEDDFPFPLGRDYNNPSDRGNIWDDFHNSH